MPHTPWRWKKLLHIFKSCFRYNLYIGKHPSHAPCRSIILFPYRPISFYCGMACVITFKPSDSREEYIEIDALKKMVSDIEEAQPSNDLSILQTTQDMEFINGTGELLTGVRSLKRDHWFIRILENQSLRDEIPALADRIARIADNRTAFVNKHIGNIEVGPAEQIAASIENLKDAAWCLNTEIEANIHKILNLMNGIAPTSFPEPNLILFKKINSVLNSIDRLEVRGRDSAGISLLVLLGRDEFQQFLLTLSRENHLDALRSRTGKDVLLNGCIGIREIENGTVSVSIAYKVAAGIGSLGDNVAFIRNQINEDPIFQTLVAFPNISNIVSSHTRWASIGAITEPNCHPVDNAAGDLFNPSDALEALPVWPKGMIYVCLNGDIDNYVSIRENLEKEGFKISGEITTDTKIIPLKIEYYLKQGHDVTESFRLAVNSFEGSHAISMSTDLEPGKVFLAQKGGGQAIFVGMAKDHYMPASEVYGFVEDTDEYLKLDGEKQFNGKNGLTSGQIVILDQNSRGGLNGVKAMYYDGTPLTFGVEDIKRTRITSRDIDRQHFPHYFLKEISESPASVEKTLQNRWKIKEGRYQVMLDESIVPESIEKAFSENKIRKILFIGQGTAGVAALACANIMTYYMRDPNLLITAYKASELSGFNLIEDLESPKMSDTLVVAISQSGTTTDTNRSIDMVKELGAYTISIVNRRDSDITFKTDGVLYTSSGRDVEMSVASTKAFYSQIVAGALLGLYLAQLTGKRDNLFVTGELQTLLRIPGYMRKILTLKPDIEASAAGLSPSKLYWAAVGSGPNKASADEIRIKLSELCYKTISSDYVEDKKHIDLSSEPLIIVCAAGTRDTVIGDIVKDTAIFHAHNATPVVIANEGEYRFAPYAESIFHVPVVSEHLAPILNTLVGHIWGYYAALAINEGSKFMYDFREEVRNAVSEYTENGMDIYELVLEKTFREKMVAFYNEFKKKFGRDRFSSSVALVADLTLLLKYLSGRLPVADFELDFGIKGTATNMLNKLLETVSEIVNRMSRPVDAIKHQAKTVTVGTSRIAEKFEGVLFDALHEHDISESQLTTNNVIVIRNLQKIISSINGSILYQISGLNLLGDATDETRIHILKKTGTLASIPSRVEQDNQLKGTKRIIVRQGNVYIGKGRRDERSILIIPIISTNADTPNIIEHLLLLNIDLNKEASLQEKIKALGGKYEHIKNIVQENSVAWNDRFIEFVTIDDLFGKSAEKIGEYIVEDQSKSKGA